MFLRFFCTKTEHECTTQKDMKTLAWGPAKLRDSIRIRIGHSDSIVMGRFENFRIGRVCPLLSKLVDHEQITEAKGEKNHRMYSTCPVHHITCDEHVKACYWLALQYVHRAASFPRSQQTDGGGA